MAFLARVKPGFLKKPGFLNLDAGEGIVGKNPVFQVYFWNWGCCGDRALEDSRQRANVPR